VPLGLTAIWLVNVVRIAVLIVIGDRVSPKLALGGFHSQAGWLGFNLVALTLLYATHRYHLFAKEHVRRTNSRHPTSAYLAPLLAAIAVQMITTAFAPNPGALYPLRVVVCGLLLWSFWPRYACLGTTGPETHGSGPSAGAPAMPGGVLLAALVGVAVFLAWIALVPIQSRADGGPTLPRWLVEWPRWAVAAWLMCKVGGLVLVTPLAEELAFRGYLIRRLVAADFERVPPGRFTWISLVASSAAFGMLHGQWLAGTLAGVGYALVVVRTGRVRDAVFAHAVTNALLMGLMVATGDWQE
jgi:CAAX prenyl protease-like protein